MTPGQVKNLVSSAQRRSASRAAAHVLLSGEVQALGLDPASELALRDALYRRLFPEHAHRLGCGGSCTVDPAERRRPHRHPGERQAEGGMQHA